jgi:hypothetical protein
VDLKEVGSGDRGELIESREAVRGEFAPSDLS